MKSVQAPTHEQAELLNQIASAVFQIRQAAGHVHGRAQQVLDRLDNFNRPSSGLGFTILGQAAEELENGSTKLDALLALAPVLGLASDELLKAAFANQGPSDVYFTYPRGEQE
jgi:hypothetical protein